MDGFGRAFGELFGGVVLVAFLVGVVVGLVAFPVVLWLMQHVHVAVR